MAVSLRNALCARRPALCAMRCGLLLLTPALVAAQQVPVSPLKPANGIVKAPFRNVLHMHEYHDGTVLMVDAMTQTMVVGDFGNGKYTKVDAFPPMPFFEFPGDTIVSSGLDMRWIFVEGTKPIGMLDRTNPVLQLVQGFIDGADSLGHVLGRHGLTPGHGDSSNIVLVNRVTGVADTITRVYNFPEPPRTPGSPAPPRPLYSDYERDRLSMDGWVAVLRREPYRIDWRRPDGTWILGKPIAYTPIPMNDREKQFYMARRARGGTPAPVSSVTNWPDTLPPWTYWIALPMHTSDAKALVLRTPSVDFPNPLYDVIDRKGELERQVTLPLGQFILGFGPKSVYVVVPHPDGHQDVERHPWP